MKEMKEKIHAKKLDTKEFELPDTHFVRDVENRVFQGIVLQCLSKIDGITLVEGNFIDNILGRTSLEGTKGISIEQDNKNHSVGVKIDVNICYGHSIPKKAEEIQTVCAEEITKLTGLHVSSVHVVFKNVLLPEQMKKELILNEDGAHSLTNGAITEEYNDEF
ncbi:MAG: Asp23/Gls24 family envelope stress response protein [Parachlamydiaceae bacterium]